MEYKIERAKEEHSYDILRLLEQIAAHHQKGRPDIFKSDVKKYSEKELKEILKDANKPVFIAEDEEGHVVGYVFCIRIQYRSHAVFRDAEVLYLDDVCVDEQCRGQAIGKKLMDAVKNYALEIGVQRLELNVWQFNQGAVHFYENCGFSTQRTHMELSL